MTSSTRVGTVQWSVLDDTGQRRNLQIKNTYYVPACPLCLLSPQHYSQQLQDHRGTYLVNFGDQVVFVWNRGRFKATMPLTSVTNVGLLQSAPGHSVFASFISMAPDQDVFPHHFACPVISDDEADELDGDADNEASLSSTASLEGDDEDKEVNTTSAPSTQTSDTSDERPTVIPFDLDHDNPQTNLASQDDAASTLDSQA
jgi:hypothetical protein